MTLNFNNKPMAHKTYFIAEAGVNHNGSLERAFELVDRAAEAGADAVKFQTFQAKNIVTAIAPKAPYQKKSREDSETQLEMLKRLELNYEAHQAIIEHCQARNITFLSTPFDLASLKLLTETFHISRIKISSGDLTNAPLLLKAAQTQKHIILSTGMSTLEEIKTSLGVIAFGYLTSSERPSLDAFRKAFESQAGQEALQNKVTLLQCVSQYPAPVEEINLAAMDSLSLTFQLPVGFSDHTEGIVVSIAAVARGAVMIEKHFTLDRSLPGPDHQASLEPNELKTLVTAIRQVEKSIGAGGKTCMPSEVENTLIARKSIVASRTIQKGELFSEENLTTKRPGNGMPPLYYWQLLNTPSPKLFNKDALIEP